MCINVFKQYDMANSLDSTFGSFISWQNVLGFNCCREMPHGLWTGKSLTILEVVMGTSCLPATRDSNQSSSLQDFPLPVIHLRDKSVQLFKRKHRFWIRRIKPTHCLPGGLMRPSIKVKTLLFFGWTRPSPIKAIRLCPFRLPQHADVTYFWLEILSFRKARVGP